MCSHRNEEPRNLSINIAIKFIEAFFRHHGPLGIATFCHMESKEARDFAREALSLQVLESTFVCRFIDISIDESEI